MVDYRNVDAKKRPEAQEALSPTAAQRASAAIIGDIVDQLDPKLLAELHDAMLSMRPHDGRAAVRRAVMSGVPSEDIADFYVPFLARAYGDMWCADELTFGEVTIAVSRLQAVLRDLETDWPCADELRVSHATLLLVIPQDIFHTLGAFVLSGQLRRKGISVKMLLGGTSKTIADELSRSAFDAIFVSASQSDSLESLRLMIDAVKSAVEETPPIVVGGAILDAEKTQKVLEETRADYATGNAEEALDFCGLLRTTQDDALTKFRG
ncbi:cobalamin B12-binding domain-containing protein [Yoonia litorea]|uniref:Methanogenic corrinoid protein MtbC1 n=1 Tax=Yoonia litorea TaxID=1123755 RepID=A0A1I6MW36_9RHOB|nr:cobalamin B12-binding domain-containing protein [Yoonia litorea]SFS19847.1 Methanogenic corrinoid protein MtbC1 [Yoonia litorea]